jgi:hypothetical protein
VLVGVSHYQQDGLNLEGPACDIQALRDLLVHRQGYDAANVTVLLNEQASLLKAAGTLRPPCQIHLFRLVWHFRIHVFSFPASEEAQVPFGHQGRQLRATISPYTAGKAIGSAIRLLPEVSVPPDPDSRPPE